MLTDSDLLNASILIVDDQSAHVQLLERMLGDAGYLNISSTTDPQQVCALHRTITTSSCSTSRCLAWTDSGSWRSSKRMPASGFCR
jgi:hypothetical protein